MKETVVNVTALQQVYWILTIFQHVKKQPRQCVTCTKQKTHAAPGPPPLPKVHVEESKPFTITGINFTEALYVIKEYEHRWRKKFLHL